MARSLAQRFASLWSDLRKLEPVLPQTLHPSRGPEVDSIEMVVADADNAPSWRAQGISGRTLVITYSDTKGQKSERQIVCRRIESRAGTDYLSALCLLRHSPRVFRIDRITNVIDPESGEIFEPGSAFFAHFDAAITSSTRYRYGLSPQQFADLNAALNVLAFMARCDGKWHPLEGDAIIDFATSYWMRAEIKDTFDEAAVLDHAARLSPDPETFWASLERCAANPIIASIIRRHVASLIDADGSHDPRELYWGQQIDTVLAPE